MQTFLPFADFADSASVLDGKRLRNQRNEIKAIFNTIVGWDDPGWRNHPIAKMWWGYPEALIIYGFAIFAECEKRGEKDATMFSGRPYNQVDREHTQFYYDNRFQVKIPGRDYGRQCIKFQTWLTERLPWEDGRPVLEGEVESPPWIGDERVHDSHKAILVYKDPQHYTELFPNTEAQAKAFYTMGPADKPWEVQK